MGWDGKKSGSGISIPDPQCSFWLPLKLTTPPPPMLINIGKDSIYHERRKTKTEESLSHW
jgi:hypothetical protein